MALLDALIGPPLALYAECSLSSTMVDVYRPLHSFTLPKQRLQSLEVKCYTRFVADHPRVMSRSNLKGIPWANGDFFSVMASYRHLSRENISDVGCRILTRLFAHVQRPSPSGKIFPSPDCYGIQDDSSSCASVDKRPRSICAVQALCQRSHVLFIPWKP